MEEKERYVQKLIQELNFKVTFKNYLCLWSFAEKNNFSNEVSLDKKFILRCLL